MLWTYNNELACFLCGLTTPVIPHVVHTEPEKKYYLLSELIDCFKSYVADMGSKHKVVFLKWSRRLFFNLIRSKKRQKSNDVFRKVNDCLYTLCSFHGGETDMLAFLQLFQRLFLNHMWLIWSRNLKLVLLKLNQRLFFTSYGRNSIRKKHFCLHRNNNDCTLTSYGRNSVRK